MLTLPRVSFRRLGTTRLLAASLLSLVLFPGCGATALSSAGKAVQTMKGDPPPGCEELGPVHGSGFMSGNVDDAKNDMRNKAAALGGNYLRLETITGATQLSGTAYRCHLAAK